MGERIPFEEYKRIRPETFPGEYSKAIRAGHLKIYARIKGDLRTEEFKGYSENDDPIFTEGTLGVSGLYCLDSTDYKKLFGKDKILKLTPFHKERYLDLIYEGGKSFLELAGEQKINYGEVAFSKPVKIRQDQLLADSACNWVSEELHTQTPANSLPDTPASLGSKGGKKKHSNQAQKLLNRDRIYVEHIKSKLKLRPDSPTPLEKRLRPLAKSAIEQHGIPPKSDAKKGALNEKSYVQRLITFYYAEYIQCIEEAQNTHPK
jgi:hypothetical protein